MHDYNTILGVIELRLSVLGVRPHEESVVKRLLAGGMSADEILEKLK